MHSPLVTAFLSHQFSDHTAQLVELVTSIANALDIRCTNVHHASSAVPIAEARELIKNSHFVIGLCTRDKQFAGSDEYSFSNAVQQELTIASDLKKPIALFVEQGVATSGFYANMSTYDILSLSDGITPEMVAQLTKGIHKEKVKSLTDKEVGISQAGASSFYADTSELEIRLVRTDRGLTWRYVNERLYRFLRAFEHPIILGAWSMVTPENPTVRPTADLQLIASSRQFALSTSKRELGPSGIELIATLSPFPQRDDFVKLRDTFESPGLNVIFDEDVEDAQVTVKGQQFKAIDGQCLINRTSRQHVRIVFPSGYPIDLEQASPVVGTFSTGIDYVVERELDRVVNSGLVLKRSFNGETELSMLVVDPLYQHFYGFAWNPPERSKVVGVGINT